MRRIFAFIVKLGESPSRTAALWRIVTRSDRWRDFRGVTLEKYLHEAVRREGARIERGWDTEGVLTAAQRERERRAAQELKRNATRPARPERALARKRAQAARRARLVELVNRVRLSDHQRQLLDLMMTEALDPADACRALGVKMSVWQNLVRKLQRAA